MVFVFEDSEIQNLSNLKARLRFALNQGDFFSSRYSQREYRQGTFKIVKLKITEFSFTLPSL